MSSDDEDPTRDCDLVALEAEPDLLPVAAGLDRLDLAELAVRLERDRRREPGAGGHQIGLLLSRMPRSGA